MFISVKFEKKYFEWFLGETYCAEFKRTKMMNFKKPTKFNDKKDQHVEMDLIFNSIFQKL